MTTAKYKVVQYAFNHYGDSVGPRDLVRVGDDGIEVRLASFYREFTEETFLINALNYHNEMVAMLKRVRKYAACMGEDMHTDVVELLKKVDRKTVTVKKRP